MKKGLYRVTVDDKVVLLANTPMLLAQNFARNISTMYKKVAVLKFYNRVLLRWEPLAEFHPDGHFESALLKFKSN